MTYSPQEILKIVCYTKNILKKSIQLGGSSIKDFSSVSGKKGLFQEKFKVYDRANKSCLKPECEGSIKKIYISNRSTFYCQKCQKIKYWPEYFEDIGSDECQI